MQVSMLLRTPALLAIVVLATQAAHAQAPRPSAPGAGLRETAPLSLQSQLGSIPLVSPRAQAKASMVRMVRLTQLSGQTPLGAPREIACPDTGCQQLISLEVDNVAQTFLADIQFVGKGIYVALHPRSAAISGVVEFRQGRPGPVFMRGNDSGTTEQRLSFVTSPALSLRRMEKPVDGQTLASGNLYTRKREPDLVLRVEVDLAKER